MLVQGMNFEAMWSVQKHSDLLFWEIAIPTMIVIVLIFYWPVFGRMLERLRKTMQRKKIEKVMSGLSSLCAGGITTDAAKSKAQTGIDLSRTIFRFHSSIVLWTCVHLLISYTSSIVHHVHPLQTTTHLVCLRVEAPVIMIAYTIFFWACACVYKYKKAGKVLCVGRGGI